MGTRIKRVLSRVKYAAIGGAVGGALGGVLSRNAASSGAALGALAGATAAEKRIDLESRVDEFQLRGSSETGEE